MNADKQRSLSQQSSDDDSQSIQKKLTKVQQKRRDDRSPADASDADDSRDDSFLSSDSDDDDDSGIECLVNKQGNPETQQHYLGMKKTQPQETFEQREPHVSHHRHVTTNSPVALVPVSTVESVPSQVLRSEVVKSRQQTNDSNLSFREKSSAISVDHCLPHNSCPWRPDDREDVFSDLDESELMAMEEQVNRRLQTHSKPRTNESTVERVSVDDMAGAAEVVCTKTIQPHGGVTEKRNCSDTSIMNSESVEEENEEDYAFLFDQLDSVICDKKSGTVQRSASKTDNAFQPATPSTAIQNDDSTPKEQDKDFFDRMFQRQDDTSPKIENHSTTQSKRKAPIDRNNNSLDKDDFASLFNVTDQVVMPNTRPVGTKETIDNPSSSESSEKEEDFETIGIEIEDRVPEISPSYYVAQPTVQDGPQPPAPLVHEFTAANKPVAHRRLIPVSQIFSPPVDRLFTAKFGTFNQMQSEVANMFAFSDDNIVVSAPTGAGKTALFEMAMARFFAVDIESTRMLKKQNEESRNPSASYKEPTMISGRRKIVYISPSKALCEERYEDWSARLSAIGLGLEVALVTGDGDPGESFRDLSLAHLILTTPEKWDSLTRRWPENFVLFASCKLFLVDEVHLVADESRGNCLESVVCRMKSMHRAASRIKLSQADIEMSSYAETTGEAINSTLRWVAVSATLPNIAEIASLFDANEAYSFDHSYRPVPLTTHVVGQGFVGENQYRFWSNLNRNVPELVLRFSDNRPTIVFCHSKPDTESLADLLASERKICITGNNNQDIASQTRVTKLQRVLYQGIAYHHAGLEADDRKLVEKAFSTGRIRVLCATSTLAMGVNLPAHLVIIKGTMAWRGGENGYQAIDQASLLQMIGRAGRPGFDTSGTAVIMTDNKSKPTWQALASSGLKPAESQLLRQLDQTINAEVSTGVIQGTESALNWMKGTLYFVQLQEDPLGHGVELYSPHSVDTHLWQLCRKSLLNLEAIGAIKFDDGQRAHPLVASHIMSQHLVDYHAMELLVQIPFDATQCQLLKVLSKMEGLQRPVRRSEKKYLNESHKTIKFKLEGPPHKVRVQTEEQKAFVLLQAAIGQIHLEDYALRQEMNAAVDYASRMLSALEEYSVRGTRHGEVVLQSLKLRRSLASSLWCDKSGVINQLMGIGPTVTTNLKFSGILSFFDVLEATDEQIEKVAKRNSPFGSNLRKIVSRLLQSTLRINAKLEYAAGSTTPAAVVCQLSRPKNIPDVEPMPHGQKNATPPVSYTLLAYTDNPGGCLVYRRNVAAPLEFKVNTPPKFGKLVIHLVASLVGLDEKVELKGNIKAKKSCNAVEHRDKREVVHGPRKMRNSNQHNNVANVAKASICERTRGHLTQSTLQRKPPKTSSIDKFVTPSPRIAISPNFASLSGMKRPVAQQIPSYFPSKQLPTSHESPFITSESNSLLEKSENLSEPKMIDRSLNPAPRAKIISNEIQKEAQRENMISVLGPVRDESMTMKPGVVLNEIQPFSVAKRSRPLEIDPSRKELCSRLEGQNPAESDFLRTTVSPPAGSTMCQSNWRQAKRDQMKSQKPAFTRKKDNPFTSFKHDPNDAEGNLDKLASGDSGIIAPNNMRVLTDAYREIYAHDKTSDRRRMHRMRRNCRGITMSGPNILAIKAAELESQMNTNIYSTQMGHIQGMSGTYDQPNHPNHDIIHHISNPSGVPYWTQNTDLIENQGYQTGDAVIASQQWVGGTSQIRHGEYQTVHPQWVNFTQQNENSSFSYGPGNAVLLFSDQNMVPGQSPQPIIENNQNFQRRLCPSVGEGVSQFHFGEDYNDRVFGHLDPDGALRFDTKGAEDVGYYSGPGNFFDSGGCNPLNEGTTDDFADEEHTAFF